MTNPYTNIAFTPSVKRAQDLMGTRASNARLESSPSERGRLGPKEAGFLGARDGFFLSSVSETGWPYVQFRGGPTGFLRVLDDRTVAWADFRGNRQYISAGNIAATGDDGPGKVAILAMDWAHRARIKLFGHARVVQPDTDPELFAKLDVGEYRAFVERAVVVTVAGFDWNCPQHITPRFTEAEIAFAMAPMQDRLAALESENEALRAQVTATAVSV
jgi:hypothetical protein